jgi:hypothetical protein
MKKSGNTGAALKTRTASWQYDSMTEAAGMDNDSNHPSYKQLSKFSGNPSKAPAGSPDMINKGRGPTTGNNGTSSEGPKKPPTSGVPAVPKQGSVRDNINRGAQVRTPGGTRAWDPKCESNYRGNPDRINSGRGPTKGNSQ